FPIDEQYIYHPRKRKEARAKLNLSDNDFLVLYTGRLSSQKNYLRLTQEVVHLIKSSQKNIYFCLAGPFDDIGFFHFNRLLPVGNEYYRWHSFYSKLPYDVQKRIIRLGAVESDQIRNLYL